jgi:hypothetical protein
MSDDNFFERLRSDAAPLRYEPDPIAVTRLQARVRERIAAQASVAHLLASWFRPIATSIAALALAAAISTSWYQESHDTAASVATVDSIASATPVDVTVGGDTFSVGN